MPYLIDVHVRNLIGHKVPECTIVTNTLLYKPPFTWYNTLINS